MPSQIINTSEETSGFDQALFELSLAFEAIGEITRTGTGIFELAMKFEAIGITEFNAEAQFELGLEFVANGFLNNEPNITDKAIFELGLEFEAIGTFDREALAIFELGLDFEANAQYQAAERFDVRLVIDILPSPTDALIKRQVPRLTVDGVPVKIRPGASVDESADKIGTELKVTLWRTSDRDLITENAAIEFELGHISAGTFVLDETLLSQGRVISTNYTESTSDNLTPNDVFSFTASSEAAAKLSLTPENDVVIYDSIKQQLSQSDFEIVNDNQGNEYSTELEAFGDLKLHNLFQKIIIERCGFASYLTNLPNFNIARVDLPWGNPYLDSFGGYFGFFRPDVFEVDGQLQILERTAMLPAGFPAPRSVTMSDWKTKAEQRNFQRADVAELTYSEDSLGFDYITERPEFENYEQGTLGQPDYLSKNTVRTIREYRKFDRPGVVIKEELASVVITTQGSASLSDESRETYRYDGFGNLAERNKTIIKLLPDFNHLPVRFTNQLARTEKEKYTWASHPFEPRRQYLRRRTLAVDGLIVVDSNNQQLEQDYKRELASAYRDGYLEPGMRSYFGAIKGERETQYPLQGGRCKLGFFEADYVAGQVIQDREEERAGDVSTSGLTSSQKRMRIYRDTLGDPFFTGRKISLNGGEAPLSILIPWAQRVIRKSAANLRDLSLEHLGYDKTLKKGATITAVGRDGELGAFLIVGRSTVFNADGTVVMSLDGRQI